MGETKLPCSVNGVFSKLSKFAYLELCMLYTQKTGGFNLSQSDMKLGKPYDLVLDIIQHLKLMLIGKLNAVGTEQILSKIMS